VSKNIKITAISKQLGRFFFSKKKNVWNGVRNLLKGQIFLLKPKKENQITLELLKEFLALKVFYLRLLLINDQFYRTDIFNNNNKIKINTTKTIASISLISLLMVQIKLFIFLNENFNI